jgi:hypothetical protein
MKCITEMASASMLPTPSFMNTGTGVQKVLGGSTQTAR